MLNKLTYSLIGWFIVCGNLVATAQSDPNSGANLSATPDYSYDSYKSRDTYSSKPNLSYSSYNHNNSSTRTFSGSVLMRHTRSQESFSPRPVDSSNNYNPQYRSNSAYYRTNPYKY